MTAPESAPPETGGARNPAGPNVPYVPPSIRVRGVPPVESFDVSPPRPDDVLVPSMPVRSAVAVSDSGEAVDAVRVRHPRITSYTSAPEVFDVPDATFGRVYSVYLKSPAREFVDSPIVKSVLAGVIPKVNPATYETNSNLMAVEYAEDFVRDTKDIRAMALTICARESVPRRQVTRIKDTAPIHWELPGHGTDSRVSCGKIVGANVCPSGHSIEPYQWYCGNPRCPSCMPEWASRTAPMVARLMSLGQLRMGEPEWEGMGLYHAVLSPPQVMGTAALAIADGKRAFDDAINLFCALLGIHGVWMLHNWRHGKGRNVHIWRDGPHVHIVGWMNPEVAINIAQAVLVPFGWMFKVVHYKRGMDTPWAVDDDDGDEIKDVYGPNGILDERGAGIVLRYIRTHVGIGTVDGHSKRMEVTRWVGRCARTKLLTVVPSDRYVVPDETDDPLLGVPEGGMDDPELWGMPPAPPPKRIPMRLRCFCAQCKQDVVHTVAQPRGLKDSDDLYWAYKTALAEERHLIRTQYRVAMCLKEDRDAIRADYGDELDGLHLEREALARRDRRLAFWAEDSVAEIQPNSQWDVSKRIWTDYQGPVSLLHNENPHVRMARFLPPTASPPWPAPRLPRDIVRSPPSRR